MAVSSAVESRSLKLNLSYNDGTKNVTCTKTINNVDPEAGETDMIGFCNRICELTTDDLIDTKYEDVSLITETTE